LTEVFYNKEIQKRIKVACAAYAYEILDKPIISDAAFDKLCLEIRPDIKTGNEIMDNFFSTHFNPYTGQWIHSHPELDKLKKLLVRIGKIN